MDILGKIKDWLTMGVVPLLALVIASALILSFPMSYLHIIGLDIVIGIIRPYVGGALVLSLSVLTSMGVIGLWNAVLKQQLKQYFQIRSFHKNAKNLTEEDKETLRLYIDHQTRSQYFSIHNGKILGLEKRGFIFRISDIGVPGYEMKFPFHIQPWAWEYLNENPNLLLPTSEKLILAR